MKQLLFSLIVSSLVLTACDNTDGTVTVTQVTVPGAPNQNIAVTTSDHYYDIQGNSPNELAAQMEKLGPTDSKNPSQHFDAWTDWHVTWNYSYNSIANGCHIGTVKVELTVNYTWPRWNKPGNAAANLSQKWENFMTALHTHESGHRDNGVRAAQEIYRGLSAMPPAPGCDVLQQMATTTGNNTLEIYRQQDIQYDQTTRHGATQGVVFP